MSSAGMPVEPPVARWTAWGLFATCCVLAVVGDSPGATLVFACAAGTAALVDVVLARQAAAPDQRELGHNGPPPPQEVAVSVQAAAAPDLAGPGVEEIAAMSDQQLCHAWRASYVRLWRMQRLPYPHLGIAGVALERARYLDELERRHPDGFTAWIAAGARAPSDPTRYLNRGARRRTD